MGQPEMREIASYLRNGSLWVGHFVVSNGDLNFGDDRFDAAHGLANLVSVAPASSNLQVHPWNRTADTTGRAKAAGLPKLDAVAEHFKLAA